MKDYEAIFITKAALADEDSKKLLSQIESEITKLEGKVENVEKWGKKRIAYPIKKNKEGIYYKLDFKMEPAMALALSKVYKLNEEILRVTIIRKGK